MRALVSAMLICMSAPVALAQTYSASGQIGYLQEWEMKGRLVKTVIGKSEDYSGSVTLRHVGLCSVNGVEEKSGLIHLSGSPSRFEGTLAMDDDNCRITASASRPYSGLLSCRNGGGVPINFSIDQAGAADQTAQRDGK